MEFFSLVFSILEFIIAAATALASLAIVYVVGAVVLQLVGILSPSDFL